MRDSRLPSSLYGLDEAAGTYICILDIAGILIDYMGEIVFICLSD